MVKSTKKVTLNSYMINICGNVCISCLMIPFGNLVFHFSVVEMLGARADNVLFLIFGIHVIFGIHSSEARQHVLLHSGRGHPCRNLTEPVILSVETLQVHCRSRGPAISPVEFFSIWIFCAVLTFQSQEDLLNSEHYIWLNATWKEMCLYHIFSSNNNIIYKFNLKQDSKQVFEWMRCVSVITQEKTIEGISKFDKGLLRHAETAEKNPLPNKESK